MSSDESASRYVRRTIQILLAALILYVFLLGIELLGASFKLLGRSLVETLMRATSDPVVGLFLGILSTALVQSSSVTTSITVGMVSAGALPIPNAVPIVMGANIGTTITNSVVALSQITRTREFERALSAAVVHDLFNLLCVLVFFPLELATGFLHRSAHALAGVFYGSMSIHYHSPLKAILKPIAHALKDLFTSTLGIPTKITGVSFLVIAFGLIFFSLFYFVRLMRRAVASDVENILDRVFGRSGYIALLAGFVITAIIQSSSMTTSLLVPLVSAGLLSLEAAYPMTLGANIGTTFTAIIAALAGNVAGLTIAFVHLLFNLCGVITFYVIKPMRKIPVSLALWFASVAIRKRWLALVYVLVLFYVIPAIYIIISRGLR
ncbi:MAG TPA: hypothetical protein ENF73_04110 [Proteobacteria bacterium]|nr:hypothetical protein [Pseudomonadota bacterium]